MSTEVGLRVGLDLARQAGTAFPLLEVALEHAHPCSEPEIEWVDRAGRHTNWCQIVRSSWGVADTITACAQGSRAGPYAFIEREALKHLLEHLRTISLTLNYGVAGKSDQNGAQFCGGIRDYLGRDYQPGDGIILRPLQGRELVLMQWMPNDAAYYQYDWLSEFSLEVIQ